MVSSGSTNRVWPLELAPWMTPSSLRRCPAITGHHEALVANGDEFLLQHAFLAMRAEEALERILNGLLLPLDVAAQAAQGHAGMVGNGAVGQNLAVQILQQTAKIADGLRAAAQPRQSVRRRR